MKKIVPVLWKCVYNIALMGQVVWEWEMGRNFYFGVLGRGSLRFKTALLFCYLGIDG